MSLWTLRHPPIDRQGRCIGQTELLPEESTAESVRKVVALAPFTPHRLLSSDQPRCARLAEGLAAHWNLPLVLTPALREMNFGEWEGRTYDDIDTTDNARWRAWCDNWQYGIPPGGESAEQLKQRVSSWIEAFSPSNQDLLVTHAGVIRSLRVLSGESWEEAMASQNPFLGWHEHPLPGGHELERETKGLQ